MSKTFSGSASSDIPVRFAVVWYNVGQFFGVDNFNVDTEIESAYIFVISSVLRNMKRARRLPSPFIMVCYFF